MPRLRVLAFAILLGCASQVPDVDAASPPRPGFTHGVSTLAGGSESGYLDGSRDVNLFDNPVNVASGPDGTLYVADFNNGKLRAIDLTGAATTVVARDGFSRPFGLAFAGSVLYVETDNDSTNAHSAMSGTIWKVDVSAGTALVVAERIGRPRGLAVLHDGNLAIADYVHHVVEIVDTTTGVVTPLAGSWDVPGIADGRGNAARFDAPYGLVQRADGALVVTDSNNSRLRVVGLDGEVTTLAGGATGFADGALKEARFDHPQGIALAPRGDLLITDLGNFRVRRIIGTSVHTIAGSGSGGYADTDDRLAAQLYGLEGLTVSLDGSTVFVADGTRGDDLPYNRVRMFLTPP